MYFITVSIMFLLPRLIPANPVAAMIQGWAEEMNYFINPDQVPQMYRTFIEEFGLGKPVWKQYVDYITKAFRGDLGTSILFYPKKVMEIVMQALPWTLLLFIPSTIVGWSIGNIWGAAVGYKRGTTFERISILVSSLVAQIPVYWLGMLLIYLLAIQVKIFPPNRAYDPLIIPSWHIEFVLNVLNHYVLPFITLTIPYLCSQVVSMRNLMISQLKSDYIVFADYTGLPDKIIRKYAFRNAVMPQVVNLSIRLGRAVGGAALIETIFAYPGTGWYFANAVSNNDYMLLQGIFTILVGTIYLAMFLSDFVHIIIDPRVRLGYRK
jgi:peptide/nickel transport system permease protein